MNLMQNITYSLRCSNLDKTANNIAGSSLEAIARPWFADFVDSRIDAALRDLNATGGRQRRALEFLGLDLVPSVA